MMQEKNEEIPMIPKHQAQAQMMHMSWTIRWLIVGIIIGFLCMVVQAYIFVSSYTSRTERWLTTYNQLVASIAEAANEKEKAGDVQQLQIP
jgi:hypothetical protein